ncbi:MAG: helix-turn-helix domain-containing protein [Nocardioidaceae bacterium]
MADWTKVKSERDAAMTIEERAVYDEAWERADLGMRLAELFYNARQRAHMTQRELASSIGTSQSAIAAIEGGSRTPTVDMLERLAKATGQRLTISLTAA